MNTVSIDRRDLLIVRLSNVLERMKKDLDYMQKDIASLKGERSDRWKCVACGNVATSLVAVPASAMRPCTRCGKKEFSFP